MWWEPHSERERLVTSAVAQLKGWFANLSRETTSPVAWGIGSAWTKDGVLVPLALLNSDHFSGMPPFRLFRLDDIPAPEDIDFPALSLPLYVMFATPPRPSAGTLSFKEQMSLVEGMINDFVPFRERIVGNPKGAPGTAAVLVQDLAANRHALLTAGHIFPGGLGSRVDRWQTMHRFFNSRQEIGHLKHLQVPVANVAGWDAAVIELSYSAQPRGTLMWRGVERFDSPEFVVVHGAITGWVSQAAVQGALIEVEYEQGRRWKNCWMMAPSGVLRRGDSGSAVFTRRDARFLGMYVGSSFLVASDKALFHYVQDAFTLQTEVLTGWQISLFG